MFELSNRRSQETTISLGKYSFVEQELKWKSSDSSLSGVIIQSKSGLETDYHQLLLETDRNMIDSQSEIKFGYKKPFQSSLVTHPAAQYELRITFETEASLNTVLNIYFDDAYVA